MGAPMRRPSLLLALALGAACVPVDYIELSPSLVTFKQPHNTVWMQAKCMSRAGMHNVQAKVTWSVKDGTVAEISPKGQLRPLKSGRTEVVAAYDDVVAMAPVEVVFVERVEVEPKELTLTEGAPSVTLAVKAFGADGRELGDRRPTLESSNKKIAQIASGGAIMPLDVGEAVIDVKVDGKAVQVPLKVQADPTLKR